VKLHVMIAMVVKVNLCTITSGGEYNRELSDISAIMCGYRR